MIDGITTYQGAIAGPRPGFLFCRVHTMDTFQTKHIVPGGGVLLFPRSLDGTGDKLLCHVVIFLSLWILYRYVFSGLEKSVTVIRPTMVRGENCSVFFPYVRGGSPLLNV